MKGRTVAILSGVALLGAGVGFAVGETAKPDLDAVRSKAARDGSNAALQRADSEGKILRTGASQQAVRTWRESRPTTTVTQTTTVFSGQ